MALNPNVPVVNPGELITSAHVNNIRANVDRLDVKLSLAAQATAIYPILPNSTDLALTTSYQFCSPVTTVTTPAGYSSATLVATFSCQIQCTTAGIFLCSIGIYGPDTASPEFTATLPIGYGVITAVYRAVVTVGGNTDVRARARTSGAAAGIVLSSRSYGQVVRTGIVPP